MARKIIRIVIALLLLTANTAFADDAGTIYDDQNFLTIKAYPVSDTLEIGGDFEFNVECTNNTSSLVKIESIQQVFDNCLVFMRDFDEILSEQESLEINPGQKALYSFRVTVPEDLFWYKDNGDFFADFALRLNYSVYEYMENNNLEKESYDGHENMPALKQPVKISNLSDGSEFIDITMTQNDNEYVFMPLDFTDGIYAAQISRQLYIENISDTPLSKITVRDLEYTNQVEELSPSKSFDTLVYSNYTLAQSDIPDTILSEVKVLFSASEKYYALSIQKELPTSISTDENSVQDMEPTDTLTATASPTPPSTVPDPELISVDKSSSIPMWVWYALAAAVIVCAVLILSLRKNKSEN